MVQSDVAGMRGAQDVALDERPVDDGLAAGQVQSARSPVPDQALPEPPPLWFFGAKRVLGERVRHDDGVGVDGDARRV